MADYSDLEYDQYTARDDPISDFDEEEEFEYMESQSVKAPKPKQNGD